jgi:hypothetical protein
MSISVMYNTCYGGFGLSAAAMEEYRKRCPDAEEGLQDFGISRHDPVMIEIVKEMRGAASDRFADIRFQRIPAQYANHYEITEYDGMESVVVHRSRYTVDAVKSILGDRALSKADKLARIAAVVHQADDELGDDVVCD